MKNSFRKTAGQMTGCKNLVAALGTFAVLTANAAAQTEAGFTPLFDGKTLNGWTLVGKHGVGYGVSNGVIYCALGGGGNLFTDKEYADFVLRLEFKIDDGSHN